MKVTGLRMPGLAGAVLALSACGGATTVTAPISPDRVTLPVLSEMPSSEAMNDAYPGFAARFDMTARIGLRCVAKIEGHLQDCTVTSASPDGLGFAEAALSLTPLIRVSPRRVDGEATDSSIVFNINFARAPADPILPGPKRSPRPIRSRDCVPSRGT